MKERKSRVWFADFRCKGGENLQAKFTRLMTAAGMGKIDFKDRFAAIKLHFGEVGNMAYLRPNWAKTVADFIRARGGRPFLTDANTLYVGKRKQALDHLDIAYENGFSPFSTGCHVLIADGLKGTDDMRVALPEGKYVKEAFIGRVVADADVIVSLTHFKLHEMTGLGGAIKNLGMGCASRAGKKVLHSSVHPEIDRKACVGCGKCTRECAHDACRLVRGKATIDAAKCVGCGRCIGACNRDAVMSDFGEPCTVMQGKIADYALAAVKGKPHFHLSLIRDVAPFCDCHFENDAPVVADIGMLASADPVALDHAAADLVNAAPVLPGSALDGIETNGDIFTAMHPSTRWQEAIAEGERAGLGHAAYELVRICLAAIIGLAATTGLGAGLRADRFGALYSPGETAVFTCDGDSTNWRVTDMHDRTVGRSPRESRLPQASRPHAITIPHDALGGKFGAFRLTAGSNETWFAFLPSKEVKPCKWVGTGTHGGHGWQRGDLRYLDLIAAAGIGVVRDDVNWDWFEQKKGEIVFSRDLRNLVNGLKARGLRYDPIINSCNANYEDQLDPEAFTRYALAFIKEFKGKIDLCEIFNEPHNFNFPRVYLPKGGKFSEWQCRPDAPWIPKHAALTRKVADAIRAFDPSITTGVGVEDYWDFFKIMLKQEFVRPTDLVTIHPYDHQHYPPEGNWFFRDGGKEVRDYLLAHGGATRIAITECGWTTYEAKRDATHAFVGNYPPCTYAQQAQYLIRFYILSRQHGIEFACQYDFMNDGPKRNYTENNFGLVHEDYTPKPSFAAVAAMTRLVGNAAPCGSKSSDEKKYRFYCFKKTGERLAAAWSLKGEAEATLPAGFSPLTMTCRDIEGNEIPLPLRNGKIVLTEVPLYLIAPAFTDYADPFVGTTATGHTTPAAAYPFGMIQAGPTTGTLTWEYCSGYRYGDDAITGYAQTALSGTGFCEYNELQVLPFSDEKRPLPMKSKIDKKTERASPGFYAVRQSDDGVNVEIAAAKRAAIYRFRWDTGKTPRLLVNLPYGNGQRGGNQIARSHEGRITRCSDGVIEGEHFRTGCIHRRKIAFAFAFDTPWTACEELPKTKSDELPRYVLTFANLGDKPLSMKVAFSMTSPEAARKNLASSIPDWNFRGVRAKTEAAWNALFARSTCTGTDEQKRNWYTALYHLYFQPNDYSDADSGRPFYTTLSLWDTFRAAQPWYTIATPDVAQGTVESFLRLARDNGRLPVMSYGGVNFDCMIGNHSVPVIVDLFLKQGAPDTPFWREAYEKIRNTLTVPHPGKPKEDWPVYDQFGYFPCDRINGEGVSRTFECSFDDACAARMAERLGRRDDAAFFSRRAQNWKNVFDASTGFARGKNAAGKWREPFDPFAFGHGAGRDNDFTEGNAFQYTWHVMHDPLGLVAAMGGKANALDKLQRLFKASDTVGGAPPDVTGLIGQYVHGNEPSHHVIYLFPYLDRPDLTAKYVREVFDRFYRPRPDGLCGNDDCGQMSAWYLFSAMGFYPFNPCGGDYVIGAPQVPRATLALPNGKRFTVVANNLSKRNAYVREVTMNGKPLKGFILRQADILAGGTLAFTMEGAPSWPLVTVRHTGAINATPRLLEKQIEIHRRHPGSCDEFWLCGANPNAPVTEAELRDLGEAARLAAAGGIAPGYQQGVTLGHGAWPAASRAMLPEDAWQRGKNGENLGLVCPRSPAVQQFEYEYAKKIFSAAPFASFWLDDDLRMGIHKASGCFCDRCIRAFNAYAGVSLTRGELVARLFGKTTHEPLREKWSAFNGESIALFAAAARRAADEVAPKCRLGYQAVWSETIETGLDYRPLLKALSGSLGYSVGIRPGAGCYDERKPLLFLSKALSVAREAERCRDYGFVGSICYEQETYPRRILQKSTGAIVTECTLALASGCDAVSLYWYAGDNHEPLADYERFASTIAKVRPEWERLSDVVRSTHLGGIARYIGTEARQCREFDLRDGTDVEYATWGLPVTVSEAKPDVWLVTAKSMAECGAADAARLAARAVVLEAETFRAFAMRDPERVRAWVNDPAALLKRFDAALAHGDFVSIAADGRETIRPYAAECDLPRTRILAACVIAPAKAGGRVALVSKHETNLTPWPTALQRQAWLDACDAVGKKPMPVRLDLCHPIRVLPRIDAQGAVKAVTMLNCSMGETGDFTLDVRQPAKKIRVTSIPPWTTFTVYP